MNNIILTRIDNRLVHGQVGVTWTKNLNANLVVVANDEVAEDKIQQKLMTVIAKSQGFDIRFFSLEKTAAIIDKAAPSQKIFLICKNPQDVKTLVDKGVEIKDLNVGNMHQSEGKKQISTKVYADDYEIDCLNYLYNKGINIFIQDVPGKLKTQYQVI